MTYDRRKYKIKAEEIKRLSAIQETTMYVPLKALLALLAGLVSLISPKLFRFAVAAYLITIGVIGLLNR